MALSPLFIKASVALLLSFVTVSASAGIGNAREPFNSQLYNCPEPCLVGSRPDNWTYYHELDRLTACDQTMLLDFSLYNPLEDPNTDVTIRSCSTVPPAAINRRDGLVTSSACGAPFEAQANLQLASGVKTLGTEATISKADAVAAITQLQSYLNSDSSCNTTIAFAYSGTAAVGIYTGSKVHNRNSAGSTVESFLIHVKTQDGQISTNLMMQWCGSASAPQTADYKFGIIVGSSTNLPLIQTSVKAWSEAKCATEVVGARSLSLVSSPIWLTAELPVPVANSTSAPETARIHAKARALAARATCRTIQVVSGDSCGFLASKCSISAADFTKFNPSSNLCSTLAIGQYVCCSSGALPDLTPKPNPDGSCATYTVQSGDFCALIGSSRNLNAAQLETFNKNTWGWTGCNNLQLGIKMCLSTGTPPMPAPVSNAICGPQVPGTTKPTNGKALADLNPCPLNVCCNIWGQCGTTGEFCTQTISSTGAPGTTGCISNCGNAIVNNGAPPSSFITLAYFEAWNAGRNCLHMDVDEIDPTRNSHVHFAFADITSNYAVDISAVQAQFDKFVRMASVKRIVSFGGWSFSTEHDTFPIFREGVSTTNRQLFANNVVRFVNQYNLDGVDFDWEYPGAPDIPGIPPGSANDGKNYLDFLKMVRAALPAGKTVSIAAPASFWYLKGFPIKEMSAVVDYIVYMTYDLHGQWDYGSPFSNPGCPNGNCLRSHVNMTETRLALSMVTKAGVPASKVVVGVSSYGRSFKMTAKGCDGPSCTFVGPDSGAATGACTETAGYISDAEIKDIIAHNAGNIKSWYDTSSESNILVYNDLEWVAWMDADTKRKRTDYFKSLNFGGTTDWAVDLQTFLAGDACPPNSPGCDKSQFNHVSLIGINWRAETCTNRFVVDAAIAQKDRWYGVGSDAAWLDAADYWKTSRNRGGLVFSQTVSNFFNGPEGMNCESAVDRNGCSSFLQCDDTNKPAGYMVLNSMVALDNIVMNFYDAIVRIQTTVSNSAGGISSTFAPIPKTDQAAKILLDCIGLGFALLAAPMWNAAFKKITYFSQNGNTLGTVKDMTNGLVSNGITITKDKIPATPGDFSKDIVAAVTLMSTIWYQTTSELLAKTFDGSDTSIDTLTRLFTDGKFLANAYSPLTDLEIQGMMAKALYAMLIPLAWRLAPNTGVFIIDAKKSCAGASLPGDELSGNDASKSFACVNGNAYYLVSANGEESDIIRDADGTLLWSEKNAFGLPPGLTSLDGTAWGTIKVADVIQGSVNSYIANGNKNGGIENKPTLSTDDINKIQDLSVTAPGVINIPICTLEEGRLHWGMASEGGSRNGDNYPCS